MSSSALSMKGTLKDFHFERKICDTLFGHVWVGNRLSDGMPVVGKKSLKLLADKRRSKKGIKVLEDVLGEARILPVINQNGGHPNVVSFVALIEDEDYYWTVTERAPGQELFNIVVKGALPLCVAKSMFRQLIQAVAFIHNRGFCHLDLSLENLIVSEEGHLTLIDFGLARRVIEGQPISLGPGGFPGKSSYVAPEVLYEKHFDGRMADMYACGICLFLMLLGVQPYDSPTGKNRNAFLLIARGGLREYLWHVKLLDRLDSDALDLLEHLLCPVNNRFSAAQTLGHPWLQEDHE